MNKPVNFELAKLLKEKEFNNKCRDYYDNRGYCTFIKNGLGYYKNEYIKSNSDWKNSDNISAPTIADVIEWLYQKFNITIDTIAEECDNGDSGDGPMFEYKIKDWHNLLRKSSETQYLKRKEAYEAAIEYVLTNLI